MPTEKTIQSSSGDTKKEGNPSRLFGLLVRKPCWTLSIWAKLLVVAVVLVVCILTRWKLCSFLSPNERVPAQYLVVEGWAPTYVIEQAVSEFNRGGYKKILTSGGLAKGEWSAQHGVTYAILAAQQLRRDGMPDDSVVAVSSPTALSDRTYTAALAVKKWLATNASPGASVNVFTLGPHGRRSWLLFQKALGGGAKVGVIAVSDTEYDPVHWWRSSEGARDVLSEAIAYVYVKLFFHGGKQPDGTVGLQSVPSNNMNPRHEIHYAVLELAPDFQKTL